MRSLATLAAAAALGLSSALLVACGSDDRQRLIPSGDAETMLAALERASQDVDAQECRRAQREVREAQGVAAQLPESVDSELRAQLDDGLVHVLERVEEECGKQDTTATTPTVTTPTTEPEPPQPTQTREEPEPEPTTPAPSPTPTIPAPPPDTGGTPPGGGGGDGRGNDGGGGTGGNQGGGSG